MITAFKLRPCEGSQFMYTLLERELVMCGDFVAMQSIIAGLDRGLLATANDETAADMAARKLEAAGEPIQLPRDLDLLQGRWRLVFTSGFATGSLGGERPGPPVGRLLPLTLGQVCGASSLSLYCSCFSLRD